MNRYMGNGAVADERERAKARNRPYFWLGFVACVGLAAVGFVFQFVAFVVNLRIAQWLRML